MRSHPQVSFEQKIRVAVDAFLTDGSRRGFGDCDRLVVAAENLCKRNALLMPESEMQKLWLSYIRAIVGEQDRLRSEVNNFE